MAYDAGEAFLRIVPSFRGVSEAINAEAARWGVSAGRQFSSRFNETVRRETRNAPLGPPRDRVRRDGEQTGRTFADSFKARVEAALRSLPDIEINADSTAAEVRIARLRTNLEQLRDQRIGVDIDTDTALATVENLKRQIEELGRESPDIAVQIDTARAREELDRIQEEIDRLRREDPEIDVHVDDHGSIENTRREVDGLRSSLVALSPLAIPLGAALVAGLAGVAVTIAAIVAGLGVLTLGLSGVGKTVDLLNQRQAALAQQSAGAAAATHQVRDAREQLADTERRFAQQQIADARDVARAQRDLADAQQAVNDARAQARRDLEDMANNATDAKLAQQQAQIDLANAQAELQRITADWTATDEQRRQAQLDVAKAKQQLVEANEKATRATVDNTKAQKAGVDGAPPVVAAIRRQRDAVEALRLARQRERRDAAEAARQIQRGERAIADAMQATAAAGASSVQQIDDQLAKVNPATLAFARFWRNRMSPVFAQLRGQAASGLLPQIERGLRIMQPLFAPLGQFIHTIARTLGGLFVDMAKAFNSPFWTKFFAFLDRNLPRWLTQFGHIFGNIATGLAGLFRGFKPIIDLIGNGLVRMTSGFANFGKHLGKNSAFQSFIAYIKQYGPKVVEIIKSLAVIAGKLIQGLAPLGALLIKILGPLTSFLSKLNPTALLAIAAAIGAVWFALGGPVSTIVVAITAAAAIIVSHWNDIKHAFSVAWNWLAHTWSTVWNGAKKIITWPIDQAKKAISWLWHGITGAFSDAWDWVSGVFGGLWDGLKEIFWSPIKWLGEHVAGWFENIGSGFETAINTLTSVVDTAWSALKKIFGEPVYAVVHWVWNEGLRKVWNAVVDNIGLDSLHLDPVDDSHIPHFASGGVYPGYTPGRDVGYIGVSGGEAIMRPEWTRAVGPSYVHAANAAARSGGEPGVRRFLGGFAGGGIIDDLNPVHLIDWVKDKVAALAGRITGIADNPVAAQLVHLPGKLGGKIIDWIWHQVARLPERIIMGIWRALGFNVDVHLKGLGEQEGLSSILSYKFPDGQLHSLDPKSVMAYSYQYLLPSQWQTQPEWDALHDLWMGESGWRWDARNPDSGAYGIPQSLPADKMAAQGDDWRTNPITQVLWGLRYIQDRYGDPANAYAEWLGRNPHWYDKGGLLEPGYTLAYNGTGQAELVAPRQTFEDIIGSARRDLRASGELVLRRDSLDELGAFVDARISDDHEFQAGR